MKLVDVNILVAAHREDVDQHEVIRSWLESHMATNPGIAISDLVLSGFLHVVTHPKVFKIPTPLAQALEFVADLRSRPSVMTVRPGSGHWDIFVDLGKLADARGNLIL